VWSIIANYQLCSWYSKRGQQGDSQASRVVVVYREEVAFHHILLDTRGM